MMRFLVPALAIVLALAAYWQLRDPSPDPASAKRASEPSSGGEPSRTSSPNARTSTGEAAEVQAPLRMRSAPRTEGIVPPVASSESLVESYQGEERDAAQASLHEGVVREIVTELAESKVGTARIEELDCHSRHCKLQLASGDSVGLVKLVDALQDERGFLGRAESMMLSRQDDDIVLYLRFAPPK